MTRINIGISPAELCDQHLVAEYRELPRMRAMAVSRLASRGGPGPRPTSPTLGTGHMAYFLPFGAWLRDRWHGLRDEMRHRGFAPTLDWRPYPDALALTIAPEVEAAARQLLVARIRERLAGMPAASWSRRERPDWALTLSVNG